MQYFAAVSGKGSDVAKVKDVILQSNPLLVSCLMDVDFSRLNSLFRKRSVMQRPFETTTLRVSASIWKSSSIAQVTLEVVTSPTTFWKNLVFATKLLGKEGIAQIISTIFSLTLFVFSLASIFSTNSARA
jgi:hypothetical protein